MSQIFPMPKCRISQLAIFWVTLSIVIVSARAQTPNPSADATTRFLENRGQVIDMHGTSRPDVLFTGGGPGMQLYLRRTGISYVFYSIEYDTTLPHRIGNDDIESQLSRRRLSDEMHDPAQGVLKGRRIDMELVGANPHAMIEQEGMSSDRVNYYLAHCPDGVMGLASWAQVIYRGIYPSIDLVIRGTRSGLKYDFVVHPGGDPSEIRLRYRGAEGISRTNNGTIRVTSAEGNLEEGRPYSYQVTRDGKSSVGHQVTVPSAWHIYDEEISFSVAEYDHSQDLVIDPTLMWGTYYGGSGLDYSPGNNHAYGETGQGVAIDGNGNVTASGTTSSLNFPASPGAFQTIMGGVSDAVVVSFDPNGARRWVTFIGGTAPDYGAGLAVDSLGYVAVAIQTNSANFPVTLGAFQTARAGATDLAVVRFDSLGRRQWSTFYGGTRGENAAGLCIDTRGNIAVSGHTISTDFPVTPGAFRGMLSGVYSDAFLVVFDSSGRRRWATLVGGSNRDEAGWIASDASGNFVINGSTYSSDFPVSPGAYQTSINRGTNVTYGDAFLISFDSLGRRNWATYFGGYQTEGPGGIAIDISGNIYVGGTTLSSDFPVTPGAVQSTYSGGSYCGFYARFSKSGQLIWSTYYGGGNAYYSDNIAITQNGNPLFVGCTGVAGILKTANNMQPTLNGTVNLVIGEFDSSGTILWDTYFGGSGIDHVASICVDGTGGFYIAGATSSIDLPIVGGYQPIQNGNGNGPVDIFIARFCGSVVPAPVANGPTSICQGDSVRLDAPPGYSRYRWSPSNETTRQIVVRTSGNYTVRIDDSLGCSGITRAVRVVVNPLPVPVIQVDRPTTFCQGDSVVLRILYPGARRFLWTTGSVSDSIVVRAPGTYAVRVTDSNGCIASTPSTLVTVMPLPKRPDISPSDTVWICPDSLTTLDIGAGYSRIEWNTSETTRTIRVGEGRYWGRVFNPDGCSIYSDTIVVKAMARFKPVIISPSLRICPGDSLLLDAGGTYPVYRWSTGDSGRFLVVRSPGIYRVSVINTSGCQSTSDSIQITLHPTTRFSITPSGTTYICPGDSIRLDAGVGYPLFRWSTGARGRYLVVRNAGTYSVSVVDSNGCQATSDSVQILLHPATNATIVALGRLDFCDGDSVQLESRAGGFVGYKWSTGDTTPRITARSGGVYWLRGLNPNGCFSNPDSLTVVVHPLPSTTINGPLTVCKGSRQIYQVPEQSGLVYVWTVTGDGVAESRLDSSAILVKWGSSSPATISVRVTNPATGCSSTATATVTLGSELIPTVTASGFMVCPGDSVELDAGDGYVSYQWSTGAATRKIYARPGVSYTVTVRDADNCRGTSLPVVINERTAPKPIVQALGPTTICTGDSVALDAGGGYSSYLWNTGARTQRIQATAAGAFNVSVRDTGSCWGRSNDIVITEYPPTIPVVRALGPTTIQDGDSITLEVVDVYATYLWSTGETAQRIIVKASGDYSVTVVDSNGCRGASIGGLRITVRPIGVNDTVIARVVVGNSFGSPGERVMIPVRMEATNLDTSNVTGYQGELRYNQTVLMPSGTTPIGVIDGADRVITFSGPMPKDITTGGDLVQLEFIALLGNAETTPVRLSAFSLKGAPVSATLVGGEFRLTGLCRNGGTRLANSDGSFGLKSVRPNPTNGVCEVEYEIVESGMTRVYVVDLLGRRVAELQSGSIDPGRYILGFDASVLGSGTYSIILETPTQRRGGVLQVVR